jgi:hypothetical protein
MPHGRFIWTYGHYTTPNCQYGRLLACLISRVIHGATGRRISALLLLSHQTDKTAAYSGTPRAKSQLVLQTIKIKNHRASQENGGRKSRGICVCAFFCDGSLCSWVGVALGAMWLGSIQRPQKQSSRRDPRSNATSQGAYSNSNVDLVICMEEDPWSSLRYAAALSCFLEFS